ncbi:intracellular growth attenuator family protein [Siccibacter turicensis]|uniref:intracellular growth attenuator family protein n=1 Tax=Siccibacter turicensis TaxID=357233 RepID=UPI0004660778|nr:intracellular growth attenuator family protein [Siccibacter turicensis]MDY0972042.1 intracellular growth attenuator family protein [Siccibacter turicensis]
MSSLFIVVATMLACVVIAGWVIRRNARQRNKIPYLHVFAGASTRRLTTDERSAVEAYLDTLARTQRAPTPTGAPAAPVTLRLNAHSNTVYGLTRSITRYGLSTDDSNKWRYYLDSLEVHLPPFWEQVITDDNEVELICTDTLPLVIGLNGHTLQDPLYESQGYALESVTGTQASIRGEESEQIELLNIRQETQEEHALSRPDGMREALLICASFLLFFFCLVSPEIVLPWLAGGAIMLLAAGLWGLFAPPTQTALREIHCLRGTPKRWGLFGESNQEQINNISLGIIDLIYPAHWQPWIHQDLGHETDIDIYLDRHVVRQGRFLSLHDEVKNFPLQHWMRSLTIAAGALVVLLMLVIWVPLDMPLKITISWLKGAQTVEATSVEQLEQAGIRVGDTLKVNGTGMCNIHTSGSYSSRQNYPFMPFDCSQIIWNNAAPLPVPQSDTVTKAEALSEAITSQLHPSADDNKVNPGLRSAIQQSGMVLLDDFSEIVQKTQDLCSAEDECVRLKNALVNLGGTKDWDTLIKRANSGQLKGTNVLLRQVSAESLDNLVTTSIAPFVARETARAAQALNSPAPGGFMIISDEGSDLVEQPWPPVPLYEHPAQDQWKEFQRLAEMLIQTPFRAEGIVTGLRTDANGTIHIDLHSIPDSAGLWRYTGICLLLLAMILCAAFNGVMAVRRYQRNRARLTEIQQYYESCLNPRLMTPPDSRPMF